MIEVENISKRFGRLEVLRQVSIDFKSSQCCALIGPNGCGKTTLIKCILGSVIPDSGIIRFEGTNIEKQHVYRTDIGYMPQIGRYPENMSIGQIIQMITELRNPMNGIDEELIQKFGLPELFHKKMSTLSGGTTQKVSAALAFLFNPKVLILDEPTAGLDPIAAEILKEKILDEKAKGKLIIITSHVLSELDDLVSEIVFMQDGKIKFNYSLAELQNSSGENRISKAIYQILKQEA